MSSPGLLTILRILHLTTIARRLISVATQLVLLAAPDVRAQSEPIDEIFVTATRRPVSTDEISSALTIIESAAVREQKLVTDALANRVGVFLQQTTPGQGAAIVRGVKGSALLHLVDGIRLNNAIFRDAPTPYFSLVPVAAVERIEVVRGTPASLYGSDAVGGIVQLVTRVPKFESTTMTVRGNALLGFDTADLAKTIRASIDAGTSRFASSLSAEYLEAGDRRTGGGERIGPSGYTSKAARLLLSATPGEYRSWLFDFHFLEQPETPRIDELVPGFGQSEPSSSEYLFAPNQRIFAHTRFAQGDGLLGLDWNVDLAWQRIVDDRITRNFQATDRRLETNRSDLYGATMSAVSQTESRSWIVGAEAYYDEVRSSRLSEDVQSGQTTTLLSRFPDGSTVRQLAIYGNLSQRILQSHTLAGGLRLSNVAVRLPETVISSAASVDANDVSGDIGWITNLNQSWQLVANAGFGFRAPNVFDLGTLGARPGNRFNIPNPNLDSEHVTQLDIGMRQSSDSSHFELTIFALQYRDRITSVLTGDTTPDGRDVVQSTNAANARIYGAEAGASLEIVGGLQARAVVNYTWGEQQLTSNDAEPADRIPPLSGELRLRYDAMGPYGFDAWARFAGEQSRLSPRDVNDVRIDPNGTSGWGILGARAYWERTEVIRLTFGLDNILDKQYRLHGSGLDAMGRNASFTLSYFW